MEDRALVEFLQVAAADARHAREVLDDVGHRYKIPVLHPPIPKTVRFAEAPALGRSILATARNSKGAAAYREVARSILAARTR